MAKVICQCGREFERPEEAGGVLCPGCGRRVEETLDLEPAGGQPPPIEPAPPAEPEGAAQEVRVEYEPPPSFWFMLPRVPLYPLTRNGIAMLITGTAFLYVLDVLVMLPGFGWIGMVFFAGYLCAYWMDVVAASAVGEDEPPDWPDLSHIYDDVVRQCALFLATAALCLTPFFVALGVESRLGTGSVIANEHALACAALGLGMLYLPVALCGVSIYRSLSGARPGFVLRAMVRFPGQYYFTATCFFVGVWLVVGGWVAAFIAGLCTLFGRPMMLFLLFVQAPGFYILLLSGRVMGLFYWCNREGIERQRRSVH
ncbi:MAG: hypothetical protein GXP25_17320 [Planctomycetes bacterium]|nr:hypothetical protein [Planctomycetota bacterium]